MFKNSRHQYTKTLNIEITTSFKSVKTCRMSRMSRLWRGELDSFKATPTLNRTVSFRVFPYLHLLCFICGLCASRPGYTANYISRRWWQQGYVSSSSASSASSRGQGSVSNTNYDIACFKVLCTIRRGGILPRCVPSLLV